MSLAKVAPLEVKSGNGNIKVNEGVSHAASPSQLQDWGLWLVLRQQVGCIKHWVWNCTTRLSDIGTQVFHIFIGQVDTKRISNRSSPCALSMGEVFWEPVCVLLEVVIDRCLGLAAMMVVI